VYPLGPFELDHVIATGGMGEVWSGSHRPTGLRVAVKMARADLSAAAVHSVLDEARAVAALSHPGIVSVFDLGLISAATQTASAGRLQAGIPYLVMEYCEGGTLAQAPVRSWRRTAMILLRTLDALAHAHGRGVLHLDLKLSNVLCPGWKLADFGIAWRPNPAQQTPPRIAGTLGYMAPEQRSGQWRLFGPWTDLYSLGCMAWRLVTGSPPSHDELDASRPGKPVFEGSRFAIPEGFLSWVYALLEPSIHHRPQRAADAVRHLLGILDAPTLLTLMSGESATMAPTATISASDLQLPLEPMPTAAGDPIPQTPPMPTEWRQVRSPPPYRSLGVGVELFALRHPQFVGRHEERDRLWGELAAVHRDGQARGVLIEGGRGSGRSSLGDWLCERAHELGAATPLVVHHDGGADGVRLMWTHRYLADGLAPEVLPIQIRARLPTTHPEDRADLAALIQPQHHPASGGRAATLLRALHRESTLRPVVWFLDDAHLSTESLLILHTLLHRLGCAVLAVVVVSDEPNPHVDRLRALPNLTSVRLGPMRDLDCQQVATDALGLDGALAARAAELAAGLPGALMAVLGGWARSDALVPGPQGMRLGAAVPMGASSDTHWAQLLARHIPDLPSRKALELAAVLGTVVEPQAWQQACEAAGLEVPAAAVTTLKRHGLFRDVAGGPMRFEHPQAREALIRSAQLARRSQAWSQLCADTLGEQVSALRHARWLVGAKQEDRAATALLVAIRRHYSSHGRPMTEMLLEEWDAIAERISLPASDPRRGAVAGVRCILAESTDPAMARRMTLELLEQSERHGWTTARPGALRSMANLHRIAGDGEASYAWMKRAVEASGDMPISWRASFHEEWAMHCLMAGRHREAQELCKTARRLHQEAGIQRVSTIGRTWAWQAVSAAFDGDMDTALSALAHAEAWYSDPSPTQGRGDFHMARGDIRRILGDLEGAEQDFRQRIATGIGRHKPSEMTARLNLARIFLQQRRIEASRAQALDCLQHADDLPMQALLSRATLLGCAGFEGDEQPWEAQYRPLAAAMDSASPILGQLRAELTEVIELGGVLAAAQNHTALARKALELALRQWRRLDRSEAAARTRAALDGLEP
jgi:eukaryotic-like serine/threonine-protein kinase